MWGNIRKKESEESTPTPNPSPHSQRKHAARGGGEHGEPSGEGLMARDPQFILFAHMTPRYVATGVDPNDLQRLVQRIERWDDWCRIWSEEAARHEAGGRAAKRGRKVTAAEANLRASIYYHYATCLRTIRTNTLRRIGACWLAIRPAAAMADPPVERIKIPFESAAWPAICGGLRRYGASAGRDLLPGLDACKEELHAWCDAFRAARSWQHWRSMGPGQGETAFELPITTQWGKVIGAVIDRAGSAHRCRRPQRRAWSVRAWARSMRRLLRRSSRASRPACRTAGRSIRRRAADNAAPPRRRRSASAATPDIGGGAGDRARPHARGGGAADQMSAARRVRRRGQNDSAGRRRAPGPRRRGPTEFVVFEEGNHVCFNISYKFRPLTADWTAERSGRRPRPARQ